MSRRTRPPGYLFALPWELGHVGGVNTVVASLIERCRREGSYTPGLLVNLWSHHRLQVRRERGLAVARLRLRSPFAPTGGLRAALAFCLTFPLSALQLTVLLRRQRTRVVNPHYPGLWVLHFVLLRALGLYRGRIVLSFHGADLEQLAGARGLERVLRDLLLRRADTIVACSRHLAERIQQVAPGCAAKICVVRNGVDVEALRRSAQNPQLLPPELRGRRYVLSIGTYDAKKGQDVLVRAFARLAARYPDLLLVLAGRSGPAGPLLARLRVQYGLQSRVLIYEDVPWHRIGAILNEALMFVLPSRQESLGIAALEAGALGKPVIASNVGGIPEFIDHGRNGLLVGVGDEQALARSMRDLLDAPEQRARLGQQLFLDVHQAFAWEVAWSAYLAICRGEPPTAGVSVEAASTDSGAAPASTERSGPSRPDVGVLALIGHDWSELWSVPHQTLTRIAERFNVVWVNPGPLPRAEREGAARVGRRFAVYVPDFWLPKLYRPAWLARLLFRARLLRARRLLREQGCTTIILYLWRPEFAEALDFGLHDVSCYHIDDEYTFSSVEIPVTEVERRLIERVDCVFIASPAMLEKKGALNPRCFFAPNGVDFAIYSTPCPEPADVAAIAHPRIGYTGYLKKQLEWGLLETLARRHADWQFVFVGERSPHQEVRDLLERFSTLSNVRFLGGKPTNELAQYPQHFDVCIMPYRQDAYTKYIYPLKLHEYLASGRPVVGTAIRSLTDFSWVVHLAQDLESWEAGIQRALAPEELSAVRAGARRDCARRNDWAPLVETIVARMLEAVERRRGPSTQSARSQRRVAARRTE